MEHAWTKAAAGILTVLLMVGILTVWAPGRWPVHLWAAGIFLLASVWAGRMLWQPQRARSGVLLIPLAGAVLWGLLQLVFGWTVYRFETWNALLNWALYLAVFWLALQVFTPPELRHTFRRALLYFGFVLSVLSVLQYFTAPGKVFWLFPVEYANVGPFLNRDHYSTFVELVLPLALFEALGERRKTLSRALMVGALLASVIAGASRAGSILVTLEILVMLFLGLSPRWESRGALRRALGWTALFGVIFAAVVGWEVLWSRFQQPDPFAGRREMLQSSLAMVRERPWTGFGLGTWPTVYPAYAVTDFGLNVFANHAHNDWAEWAAEGGVPFLLLLLSIAIWSFRQALRFPWGVGVVAAFCHSAVDFPMQRPALAALVFALLGTVAAAEESRFSRRLAAGGAAI
ncbi:MAG: O-antigen ligase family protein [Bryobacteraceae bacterium]